MIDMGDISILIPPLVRCSWGNYSLLREETDEALWFFETQPTGRTSFYHSPSISRQDDCDHLVHDYHDHNHYYHDPHGNDHHPQGD